VCYNGTCQYATIYCDGFDLKNNNSNGKWTIDFDYEFDECST